MQPDAEILEEIERKFDRPWMKWLAACILAALFIAMSWTAVRGKSPTIDEPWEFGAAWAHVFLGDDRVCCQDPPLFLYVMMLPMSRASLHVIAQPSWDELLQNYGLAQLWIDQTLYHTPGNDAAALIQRSRGAMVFLGGAVVALATLIAWRLGGAAAGLMAGTLLAFDPTLLAHAPLLKNDTILVLVWLMTAAAALAVVRCATWPRVIALVVCVALAPVAKVSGVLAWPVVALTLLLRVFDNTEWRVFSSTLTKRSQRFFAASVLSIAMLGAIWLSIWTIYGFRFSPTPNPDQLFDESFFVQTTAERSIVASQGWPASKRQLAAWRPDFVTNAVLFAVHHRLLPDAYCMGFMHTRAWAMSRQSFLLGNVHSTGWWYYFPLAILFKLPTAILLALLILFAKKIKCYVRFIKWNAAIHLPWPRSVRVSPLIVGGLFFAGFLGSTMTSNLNLGVRHVLPVWPILIIFVAIAMTSGMKRVSHRPRIALCLIVVLMTVGESLHARPNYLAFFNWPCGGSRGGIRLLGDSNLDWGQDLNALKIWREAHRDVPLYVSYFGPTDPQSAGLDCLPLPDTTDLTGVPMNAVIAISATHLQQLFLSPQGIVQLEPFRRTTPREVLNGSIYLFDMKNVPLK